MKKAFTIIELVVVVTVIGILVAVISISYQAITSQARENDLKGEVIGAAMQIQDMKVANGVYPDTAPDFKKSTETTLSYSAGGGVFCVSGSSSKVSGKTYYATSTGGVKEGRCPLPTTMQTFTANHCNTLPVYTGSNSSAVVSLADSRGDTTRTYEVAKLADNKCWMLTNLKLGSTTGTTTLTPADSNVATNFTLPQLTTTGVNDYDLPRVYGPIPGDTGSGATDYGYLYNWSAATAGESTTTMPAGSGNAPYSICPVNWRLPIGGVFGAGEFAMLNAKMNNANSTNGSASGGAGFYENWQYTGPFRGVLSGYWYGNSFINTSSYGSLWSRSAHASGTTNSHDGGFSTSLVYLNGATARSYGYAVRCLIN